MAGCPHCGEMHSQLYVCEAAKQAQTAPAKTSTYRYRDPEKRRAYMREYMAKRKAKQKEQVT